MSQGDFLKNFTGETSFRTYGLNIGGVPITLRTEQPLEWEEAFQPFRAPVTKRGYEVVFRRTESLPPLPEEILWENAGCRVHPDGKGGFLRSFYDPVRSPEPYGVGTYHLQEKTVCIRYLDWGVPCVSEFSNSFFHIGLESLLIGEKRICLHAALVRTSSGGLLFCGPSGIGKSTQAKLWCSAGLGSLLNGDRPILGKKNGVWTGWGSPYAGSSRCYVNQSCPISAIVLLEQAPACSIRQPDLHEKFHRVFSQVTVSQWDPAFVAAAMDLTEDLIRSVPVLVFACTPAAEAVPMLQSYLKGEQNP